MRFFLEKAEEHVKAGLDHQRRGELERARFDLLKASEYLFRAAAQSDGDLRLRRTEQAEQLLAQAQELEVEKPRKRTPRTAPSSSSPLPTETDDEPRRWRAQKRPGVRFDDVAGLSRVKEQIRTRLVYPFTHPELAEKFGIQKGGGILLFGPPGTGKTLLARAVAGEVDAPFYTIKPSEIMSKWVGEAEKNVRELFDEARGHERAVIFIDEIESLVPQRRTNQSTVMARVVPQFLAELDGFEKKPGALLFIGATNEPWSIDEAVMRPGRLDEKIYVPLPDAEARLRILQLRLDDKPLSDEVELEELAREFEGFSGADIAGVCSQACDIPFVESVKTGIERDIAMSDFLTVTNRIRPSVDDRTIARFEKYCRAR